MVNRVCPLLHSRAEHTYLFGFFDLILRIERHALDHYIEEEPAKVHEVSVVDVFVTIARTIAVSVLPST